MLKTIYNLEYSDTYWTFEVETGEIYENYILNKLDMDRYLDKLKYGYVWLTRDDCKKYVDKLEALSKINKRVSELEQDSKMLEGIKRYTVGEPSLVNIYKHKSGDINKVTIGDRTWIGDKCLD